MIGDKTIRSIGVASYNGFHVKTYLFEDNFERTFGTDEQAIQELKSVIARHQSLRESPKSGRPYLYSIAFPWASQENDRMIDYYGFDFDSKSDKCNPGHYDFVLKNGLLDTQASGCETGLIILGKEGELRRKLVEEGKSLTEYIYTSVELGNLGPIFDRRTLR